MEEEGKKSYSRPVAICLRYYDSLSGECGVGTGDLGPCASNGMDASGGCDTGASAQGFCQSNGAFASPEMCDTGTGAEPDPL